MDCGSPLPLSYDTAKPCPNSPRPRRPERPTFQPSEVRVRSHSFSSLCPCGQAGHACVHAGRVAGAPCDQAHTTPFLARQTDPPGPPQANAGRRRPHDSFQQAGARLAGGKGNGRVLPGEKTGHQGLDKPPKTATSERAALIRPPCHEQPSAASTVSPIDDRRFRRQKTISPAG